MVYYGELLDMIKNGRVRRVKLLHSIPPLDDYYTSWMIVGTDGERINLQQPLGWLGRGKLSAYLEPTSGAAKSEANLFLKGLHSLVAIYSFK